MRSVVIQRSSLVRAPARPTAPPNTNTSGPACFNKKLVCQHVPGVFSTSKVPALAALLLMQNMDALHELLRGVQLYIGLS